MATDMQQAMRRMEQIMQQQSEQIAQLTAQIQSAMQRMKQIMQQQSEQIAQLTARIQSQQQMGDAVAHAAAAAAAAAVAGMHSNTTQGKGDGKAKDKGDKSALKCSNSWCNKSGHVAKDCWKAKPTSKYCPICGPEKGKNHTLDKCFFNMKCPDSDKGDKSALKCSNSWCNKSGHVAEDCWKAEPTGEHCPIKSHLRP